MEDRLDEQLGVDRFVGVSRGMERVRDQIRQMAGSRGTVLIEGETGTGKSLAAKALHHHGPGRDEPLVGLSFTALPPHEAEAQLFGVETADGSVSQPGTLEQAGAGTLLLDEVGEAAAPVQIRLLRLLQDREFERVGGRRPLKSQARLVTTSSRDLGHDVEAGHFRADLLRRLGAVRLALPPLRERPEDMPFLVEMFIGDTAPPRGRKVTGVTPGLLEELTRHTWPGNVRELRSVIAGMIALVDRRRALDLSDLPSALKRGDVTRDTLNVTVGMTVEEAERILIEATLRHTGGDKTRAAAVLGIGLRTLYRRIRALGLR